MYVNDKTVKERESSVTFQENIGIQRKAVGSPYVSQNAAETLLESHKLVVHMSNMPFMNTTEIVILHVLLQLFLPLI